MFPVIPEPSGRGMHSPLNPGDVVRTAVNLTEVGHYDWWVGILTLSPRSRSLGVPDSGDYLARQALFQALFQGKWNPFSPLLARRQGNMPGMVLAPIPSMHSGLWLIGYPPDYLSPGVYHYRELMPELSVTTDQAVLARSLLEQIATAQAVAHLRLETMVEAFADFERELQRSSDATAMLGELPLPFEEAMLKQYGGEFDPGDPHGWRMLVSVIADHYKQRLATSEDLTKKLAEAVRSSSALHLDDIDRPGEN